MPSIFRRFSSLPVFLAATIFAGTMISADSSFGQDKQQGFLTNYSLFKPGAEGEANLIWVNPKFEFPGGFGAYDKVMIDPITVYFSDDAAFKGVDPDELRELTRALRRAMIDALKDRYPIVEEPGEDVLLVVAALTGIKPSKPVLDTVTSIIPTARVLSFAKKKLTGKHSFVGEAAIEAALLDSLSLETLVAVVDKRSGGKMILGEGKGKYNDAEAAFAFWAKKLRQRLDAGHGG